MLFLLWLFFFLSLPSDSSAAPFAKFFRFTQPDRTQLTLWGEGDEFQAVFETGTGYTVLFSPEEKAYFYARLAADGNALLSTGVAANYPPPAGLARHIRVNQTAVAAAAKAKRVQWATETGLAKRWTQLKSTAATRRQLSSAGGPAFAPPAATTTGNKVGLTLLVDFPDEPGTISKGDIEQFLNSDAYTGYGNNGSVKQYFQDVSGGRLNYTNVVTAYVRMQKTKSYYNDISKGAGDQGRLLVSDAIAILRARDDFNDTILPTFNLLTTDGADTVLALNVFFAGANSGSWLYGLWPHTGNLVIPVMLGNGKTVSNYQISDIDDSLEIGTFSHENGHLLCGFPDLYDYDYDSRGGAGVFSLMGFGGSGPNPTQVDAYLKTAAGWTTVTDLSSASSLVATLTAAPDSGYDHVYRYTRPGMATEYFLLENRQKIGRDAQLPGSGIAVWHVDELGDRDNQSLIPNDTHLNYELTLVQADNLWHLEKNINYGNATDLYFAGNSAAAYSNQLTDSSSPNSRWWDGTSSGLSLNTFSENRIAMTVAVGNAPDFILTIQPKSLQAIPGDINAATSTTITTQAVNGYANPITLTASGLPPGITAHFLPAKIAFPGTGSSSLTLTADNSAAHGTYSIMITANGIGVSQSDSVTLEVNSDPIPPLITAFTLPANSTSRTVAINAFVATDNKEVTGYLVSEFPDTPALDDPHWSNTPPDVYTFATDGNKTLHAWARDGKGNLSISKSGSVLIDSMPPTTAVSPAAGAYGSVQSVQLVCKDPLPSGRFFELIGGTMQGNILALNGEVTTFLGDHNNRAIVDGVGNGAAFYSPLAVTFDGTYLYIGDNSTIRRVTIATNEVKTLAGQQSTYGAVDGIGSAASFDMITGVTTDGTNLYIVDHANPVIRKMVIATGEVTTIAGNAAEAGYKDGVGAAARFNGPTGITTDGINLYVTDKDTNIIRQVVIATGKVTTLAGNAGNEGAADGTGGSARFKGPGAIATDGVYLYVADSGNYTMRKVMIATGSVTTMAGKVGTPGLTDGSGTYVRFSTVGGVTTDGVNLYFTDAHTIRMMTIVDAKVTTIAGNPHFFGLVDGTGVEAIFHYPNGIVTDGSSLYIADTLNYLLRKMPGGPIDSGSGCQSTRYCFGDSCTPATPYVDSIGIIANSTLRFSSADAMGNNEAVKEALFVIDITPPVTTATPPTGAYSSAQNVLLSCDDTPTGSGCEHTYYCLGNGCTPTLTYAGAVTVAANQTLRFFSKDKVDHVETVREATYIIDNVPPTTTAIPPGGTYQAAQNVTLSCTDTGSIITPVQLGGSLQGNILVDNGAVSTIPAIDTSSGTAATFDQPAGITTDGVNLYVADVYHGTIRQVSIATGLTTTLAGEEFAFGANDGIGSAARFHLPYGITTDGVNLYVADIGKMNIRKVVIATGEVTTLAGAAGVFGYADGFGTEALFMSPYGITTDGVNLYVADAGNYLIRKIVIATGEVSTLAGSPGQAGVVDGTGAAARFGFPIGLTTDGIFLYVADDNTVIRKVEIATGAVTTLAGSAGQRDSVDGIGAAARFNDPGHLTTDGINLYVPDAGNKTIRRVVIKTGEVTTIAGSPGQIGFQDGSGATARFNFPRGITTDGTSLYVADTNNSALRKLPGYAVGKDGSGCNTTFFCLGNNCTPTTLYDTPIAIASNSTLRFYSTDKAGNSESVRQEVYTLNIPDNSPPEVTAFTIPAYSQGLTVPISAFTATDNLEVTGYLVTESSMKPLSGAAGWSNIAQSNYTFAAGGLKGLCAWAKDAVGNISAPLCASVGVNLHYSLTINIFGGGVVNNFNVNSPPFTPCSSGLCQVTYDAGSVFTLRGAPSVSFANWMEGCTGSGDCAINLTNNMTVTAIFNPLLKIQGFSTAYQSLQAAYDWSVLQLLSSVTLRARNLQIDGDLTLNQPLTVTFEGGYSNSMFSSVSGYTTLQGVMRISKGRLNANKLIIR
ncbi:MAG: M6 family metalloprotease domain-containing protein [Desulfuromonadaceae bacterium]